MKKLVIIGAGQYGKNVRDIVISNGNYDKILFADDNSDIADYTIEEAISLNNVDYFVAIGNPKFRENIFHQLNMKGNKVVSIVHKSSYVASSVTIGSGCIIEPGAIINANVEIFEGVFICAGVVVNHNVKIGSYSQIDVGAVISSNREINEYSKIEAGEVYV